MKSQFIWILFCALLLTRIGTCTSTQVPGPEYPNSSGFYVKGFGGMNWAQTPTIRHTKYHTNEGYVLGAALGYHFCFFSLEGEFTYRHNTITRLTIPLFDIDASGDLRQYCGFVNGIFDIPVTLCFRPYIGGGIGYRHIKPGVNFDERSDVSVQDFIDSRDDWGVYQALAGFCVNVIPCIGLQLDYRYVDGWANHRCRNHSLCLGAKIGF